MKITNKTISRVAVIILIAMLTVSLLVGGIGNPISLILIGMTISMLAVDEIASYEFKQSKGVRKWYSEQ